MTEQTKPTLLERLQLEFPSLDSSLIAAFLSEQDQGTLTKKQLRKLRRVLTELAAGADIDEQFISDSLSPPSTNVDGSSLGSGAVDRNDENSAHSTATDPTSSLASPRSISSTASFSTPLGFLRAAFPGVPPSRLERVITNASYDGGFVDGVDIERAVQLLLGEEYPLDLGEDSNILDALGNDSSLAPRSERPIVSLKGKKKKDKPKAILVNDIRQRPHVSDNPDSPHGTRSRIPHQSSDVDIWTSVSSLSVQLAALLRPHPESFFKSFFHSPESKTPATAVRRALTAITSAGDGDVSPLDMAVMANLQDILRSTSEYNELSADERQRLLSDAHLCLRAVGSQVDNALDLVWLLQGLEDDDAAGWKIAPYHRESLPRQDGLYLETSGNTQFSISVLRSGRSPGRPPSPSQNEWSIVTSRKPSTAANLNGVAIPPSNGRHGTSTNEIGLTRDDDSATLKERRDDLESRLRETSMLAARAWKGGNSKNVGRQVAHYHVEEMRRLQEELKDADLDIARARVHATKKITTSDTTIDLHYTTVAQAIILAKEFLRDYRPSDTCPMQIITGRGNHSIGGVAVLGPAVYDALIKDGWNASKSSAGLVVYGRLRN